MDTAAKVGMTRNEKQVVGYTSLAHGLTHGLELTYGAVLVVIALEFDVTLALLGVVATVSALAYGLTAFPAGAMADRVGSKRMLVLSLGGSGGAAVLAALAPNIGVLALALTLMGLLGGIYHPAGLALIARGVRERARGMGFHGIGGNIGTAAAPLLAAVLASAVSWRASFAVFAVLAALVAFLVQVSSVREENPAEQAPRLTQTGGSVRGQMSQRTFLLPLILIFVINAFEGFIYRGTVTFLPLHLSRHLGFDIFGFEPVVIGGSFATVALLFGIGGQFIGGELGERFRRELVIIPVIAATVPALLLVGSTQGVVLVAAAAAFAFFTFMAQPSYSALVADYSATRIQGRVFGLAFLVSFSFGSSAGTVGGVLVDRFDTPWVFITLAGFAFLILLVSLGLFGYARLRGERWMAG